MFYYSILQTQMENLNENVTWWCDRFVLKYLLYYIIR